MQPINSNNPPAGIAPHDLLVQGFASVRITPGAPTQAVASLATNLLHNQGASSSAQPDPQSPVNQQPVFAQPNTQMAPRAPGRERRTLGRHPELLGNVLSPTIGTGQAHASPQPAPTPTQNLSPQSAAGMQWSPLSAGGSVQATPMHMDSPPAGARSEEAVNAARAQLLFMATPTNPHSQQNR
ncbi:MAG: hypothetical protein ACK4FF_11315 [Limnobacter sp.]|uniref:hypothetical protein n=1 Tax=Limnobacter sp. TaxID=2003368 RepID=UPI00391B8E53